MNVVRIAELRGPLMAGLLWSAFALGSAALRDQGGAVLLVWLPSAVAIASLYCTPKARWPALLAALFIAQLLTFSWLKIPPVAALGFAVANQVGAPLSASAGAVAVLGGVATVIRTMAAPDVGVAGPVTVLVLAALGTAGLTVAGGVLGDRAARAVPMPVSGCAGVCAGCSLVEGCSPTAADPTDEAAPADTAMSETARDEAATS